MSTGLSEVTPILCVPRLVFNAKINPTSGRARKTIRRVVRGETDRRGRPPVFSQSFKRKLVRNVIRMSSSQSVNSNYFIKKFKVSRSTFFRILRESDVHFSRLPNKSVWKPDTIQKRADFATKYSRKNRSFWRSFLYLDNKSFPVCCNPSSKEWYLRRGRQGAWKTRKQRFTHKSVKPRKSLKFNTGEPPVTVSLAVHYDGTIFVRFLSSRWNSRQACLMYASLARRTAHRRICEDNDPSGFQSRAAHVVKRELGFEVLRLPPRTPELMPLDFSLWAYIERRMRVANLKIVGRETRVSYLYRLRKVIQRTPVQVIQASIDAVYDRVRTLKSVNGDIFVDWIDFFGGQLEAIWNADSWTFIACTFLFITFMTFLTFMRLRQSDFMTNSHSERWLYDERVSGGLPGTRELSQWDTERELESSYLRLLFVDFSELILRIEYLVNPPNFWNKNNIYIFIVFFHGKWDNTPWKLFWKSVEKLPKPPWRKF